MVKNKKILFYIERFGIIGGAENSALRLVKALTKKGYEIEVLSRQWAGQKEEDSIEGIKVWRESCGDGKLGTLIFFIKSLVYLKMYKEDYDILHMHGIGLFSGLLAKAFKPNMSIIKTTTEKDVENVANYPHIGKRMLKSLDNIDYFVCTSKAQEAEVKKYLPNVKTVIIGNGIDTEEWKR